MAQEFQLRDQVLSNKDVITQIFPTIYILLGGTGMKTGMALRRKVLEAYGVPSLPFQEYLWLDTDENEQKAVIAGDEAEMANRLEFTKDEKVPTHISLAEVKNIMALPHDYKWLTDQWLNPNFLASLGVDAAAEAGARQIRALGRLAFELRFNEFKNAFENKLNRLRQPDLPKRCENLNFTVDANQIEVVLVCSIAGGTGSGAFIQAAKAVQSLSRGYKVNISGYLLMPSVYQEYLSYNQKTWIDVQSNAYASLQELNALSSQPSKFWIKDYKDNNLIGNPFAQIYLVEKSNQAGLVLKSPGADKDAFNMIADSLFYDFEQSEFGIKKRSHRNNVRPHLANVVICNIPIDDGTDGGESSYVFRFPTLFGSFGVARIPFDRQRLQRAAGSLLAKNLLDFLISSPEKEINRLEIRTRVLPQAQLSLEQVISGILTDPTRTISFAEIIKQNLSKDIQEINKKIQQHFQTEGMSTTERISRLKNISNYAQEIKGLVDRRIQDEINSVSQLLTEGPMNVTTTGKHYRHILEQQGYMLELYKQKFSDFISSLLADPRNHGFKYAVEVCLLLQEDLREIVAKTKTITEPQQITFADVDIHCSQDIDDAALKQAEADALWLPLYGSIAKNFYKQKNQMLLEEESNRVVALLNKFIQEIEKKFNDWCRKYYEYHANRSSTKLFDMLASFIGHSTQVNDGYGQTRTETSGLLKELNDYENAVKSASHYFKSLNVAYSTSENSSRNEKPLLSEEQIHRELTTLLEKKAGLNQTKYDILPEEWIKFAEDLKYLAVGKKDTYHLLTSKLMELSKIRHSDASQWNKMKIDLEIWTVNRLISNEFLKDENSLKIISNKTTNDQLNMLQHVAKSSEPWLAFAQERRIDMQEYYAVGVETTKSDLIQNWQKTNAGHLPWQEIVNRSGSITMYRETMAFPIFTVKSIIELENAYQQIQSESELLRRHTMQDYLSLPLLRPPFEVEQAQHYFLVDRLAFEAVLFGLFKPDQAKQSLTYVIVNDNGVREIVEVSNNLNALSRKVHKTSALRIALEKDISYYTQKIQQDGTWAKQCLTLITYTFNNAYKSMGEKNKYLEHQLALSISRKWLASYFNSESGKRVLQEYPEIAKNRLNLFTTIEVNDVLNQSDFKDSTVTSNMLNAPYKLLCLDARAKFPQSVEVINIDIYSTKDNAVQAQNLRPKINW